MLQNFSLERYCIENRFDQFLAQASCRSEAIVTANEPTNQCDRIKLFLPLPVVPKGILNSFWTNNIGDPRFITDAAIGFALCAPVENYFDFDSNP